MLPPPGTIIRLTHASPQMCQELHNLVGILGTVCPQMQDTGRVRVRFRKYRGLTFWISPEYLEVVSDERKSA